MDPWNMTPRKAMHELAMSAALRFVLGLGRDREPGTFIARQPEEVRALLKDLRSDDLADVAPHLIALMCCKEHG